jgi:hypothetical protein
VNKLSMASIYFNNFQFVFSVWVWFSCRINLWQNSSGLDFSVIGSRSAREQVTSYSWKVEFGSNPMDRHRVYEAQNGKRST